MREGEWKGGNNKGFESRPCLSYLLTAAGVVPPTQATGPKEWHLHLTIRRFGLHRAAPRLQEHMS
jgi:hypothetical protein